MRKLATISAAILLVSACHAEMYFPPPGESLAQQSRKTPAEVGLKPDLIPALQAHAKPARWALWRDGHLIHVEGEFNRKQDVASLRKTWHALTVGAAIHQGKISSVSQQISVWVPELTGAHAAATWWHVITQTSGFDYPYGEFPAFKPGEIWTYSDKNPRVLGNALARVYGKKDFRDNYAAVLQAAYFGAIGMTGWQAVPKQDGVRLVLDLEDMGRLGLLVLARGRWNGVEVVPQGFVEQLERKQTDAIHVNYHGPDDGTIGLDPRQFPEAPYGFMTWVNTDGDFYPGAEHAWAWGAGAGGTYVLWNRNNGVVFAGVGINTRTTSNGIPHLLERGMAGPNPLVHSVSVQPMPPVQSAIRNPPSAIEPIPFTPPATQVLALGSFAQWQCVEVAFTGPASHGAGDPNPFSIFVDATLTAPSGRQYRVPGFYDGDGQGGLDGHVWKVRFSADEVGEWTLAATSAQPLLAGYRGTFTVTAPAKDAPDFHGRGRLEAVGTAENRIRYLKFRDGPYWLKAGCDDPENFLGQSSHYDTPDKRRAAVDYLAAKGINSLYLMTHNLDGDDQDVWPWLGRTAREAKANSGANARFDIARLNEWRELFDYLQTKGVAVYLVLEDDSAWKGYDHARYYRELVARFGYLPALLFNFNEEYNENYKLAEAIGFMRLLAELDPFAHPRGIHNVNAPTDAYIDAPSVDFTSIQTKGTDPLEHHPLTLAWLQRCQARQQRVLMVGYDEGRPEEDRRAWWSAYLGGGTWEAHVRPPYDRPMSAWATVWTELGGARAFMESLPFWEMEPAQGVVKSGHAFCLAKPGQVYALYLPSGGPVTVELPPANHFTVAWWNPANGKDGAFQHEASLEGGRQTLTPPGAGDWAVRLVKQP